MSLKRRGDVFDMENQGGDFDEERWSLGPQLHRNTNVGQSGMVTPDSADFEMASSSLNVSMLGKSDFVLINSSWTVGKSRRPGSSGPDYSHEYQDVPTGQRTCANTQNRYVQFCFVFVLFYLFCFVHLMDYILTRKGS